MEILRDEVKYAISTMKKREAKGEDGDVGDVG